MAQEYATVASASGLHARPAALFVEAVNNTGLEVTITVIGEPGGGESVDASSILALMSLGIPRGTRVLLEAEGAAAAEKLRQLAQLLETDLDAN